MQKILPLGPDAFALWDIHNAWRAEPSRVHMWVSPDSARGEAVELENHRIARSKIFETARGRIRTLKSHATGICIRASARSDNFWNSGCQSTPYKRPN